MTRRTRIGWLLLILLALAAVQLLRSGAIVIPEAWKPWVPLRIADPPNLLTGWKLMRASNDAAMCQAVLAQSGFRYTPVDDRETDPGCGFNNAVRITRTSAAVEPFTLSCRAALSLAMWERHVLQPEAQLWLGSTVSRIEHFGSYACRNVYGRENASRSRHATADAFDIAGFVLEDGRRVRVVRDWRHKGAQGYSMPRNESADTRASSSPENGGATVGEHSVLGAVRRALGFDTEGNRRRGAEDASAEDTVEAFVEGAAEAGFLHAVHRGACRYFDAVLGPAYNAAHADHFHFDRGGFRACR